MGAHLVGYDVDAIGGYVFAPVRPVLVNGGSRLIERFEVEAGALADSHDAETVYTGGGNGLFLAPSHEAGLRLAAAIEATLNLRTDGGATCTTATAPRSGSFAGDWARLRGELARRRDEKALDLATEDVLRGDLDPSEHVCKGCGLEPASGKPERFGNEPEEIGEQCRSRHEEGQQDGAVVSGDPEIPNTREIQDLFPGEAEGGRRGLMAAVYLDANRAGDRLATLQDAEAFAKFAEGVRKGTRSALHGAIEQLDLGDRVLTPVVGGDDVFVLCAAGKAPALLDALWRHLDERLAGLELRFSAGMTVGSRYLPLRLLFESSQQALALAKESGPDEGVVVTTLGAERRLAASGPLFGGFVPRSRWWGQGATVQRLLRLVAEVDSAQRAGMARDVDTPSSAEARLNLEYRAAATQEPRVNEALDLSIELAGERRDGRALLADALSAVGLGLQPGGGT